MVLCLPIAVGLIVGEPHMKSITMKRIVNLAHAAIAIFSSIECFAMKVAVTGTTGRLGRQAIQILSSRGIETRCLLRHAIDSSVVPSVEKDALPSQVASYISNLPHVTMVKGDATDANSCKELVKGCDVVLALHGPVRPPPFQSLFCLLPETDPKHSRSVNYIAVQNLINAARESGCCKRIVRVTGKGEEPTAFFTVLINMLGNMAKAWNYEGEQLLRTSDIDYTIIRPGVMGNDNIPTDKALALADNGQDLQVTAVTHSQIASLCVDCLEFPNTARSTLTAMNVKPGMGAESYGLLLAKVQPDSRSFPKSLLYEHKKAARTGAAILVAFAGVFLSAFVALTNVIGGVVISLLSKKS
jgi:nucleoside-diphosphate-sugar epimerase